LSSRSDVSRRRACVALLALAAVGVRAESRTYELAPFDAVVFDATGDLVVEQSGREQLVVDAEPAVLAKLAVDVTGRRLRIGFGPGPLRTKEPIRFRLDLRQLASLDLRGSAAVRIGALDGPELALMLGGSADIRLARLTAQRLDVRLAGSGDIAVEAGQVERQRVAIDGAGRYAAPELASRDAEVSIAGSGDVRLAASDRLTVSIAGSGDVWFRGRPQLTQSVGGAGRVRPLAAR
jgi:hypothetical protein